MLARRSRRGRVDMDYEDVGDRGSISAAERRRLCGRPVKRLRLTFPSACVVLIVQES